MNLMRTIVGMLVLGALCHELDGELQVLLQAELGAIEHVGVEEVALAFCSAFCGGGDEGLEEPLDVLRVAVIGVEGNEDVVALSQNVSGLSEHNGTKGHVFHVSAGGKLAAASADLDDAVGLALSEGTESAAQRREGGDIDGGVGVPTFLGGIKHGTELSRCGNWHGGSV
jgi:hypothetical protein